MRGYTSRSIAARSVSGNRVAYSAQERINTSTTAGSTTPNNVGGDGAQPVRPVNVDHVPVAGAAVAVAVAHMTPQLQRAAIVDALRQREPLDAHPLPLWS